MVLDTSASELEQMLLERDIERFLYKEAALLDERRFSDWIDLMADDVHYHMPIRRNIKFGDWQRENSDPAREISWFDEGKRTLAGRVRQLETGVHWPEEPISRIRHLITNVRVLAVHGDEVEVNSNFHVYLNHLRDEEVNFIGTRYDLLRRDPVTGWKIARRKILLDQNVLLAKVITTFF